MVPNIWYQIRFFFKQLDLHELADRERGKFSKAEVVYRNFYIDNLFIGKTIEESKKMT